MPSLRFRAPRPSGREPVFLVAEERWCAFYDRLEIGRDEGGTDERPGVLLVADATVSRSHCLLAYPRRRPLLHAG